MLIVFVFLKKRGGGWEIRHFVYW